MSSLVILHPPICLKWWRHLWTAPKDEYWYQDILDTLKPQIIQITLTWHKKWYWTLDVYVFASIQSIVNASNKYQNVETWPLWLCLGFQNDVRMVNRDPQISRLVILRTALLTDTNTFRQSDRKSHLVSKVLPPTEARIWKYVAKSDGSYIWCQWTIKSRLEVNSLELDVCLYQVTHTSRVKKGKTIFSSKLRIL